MHSRIALSLALSAATTVATSAQSTDWKKALERTLEGSIYVKSDVAAFDGNRVTHEGTALVVKRSGLLGSPARYLGAVNTKVRDGRVVQPGGTAAFFSDRATTQFRVGDVVYLTDVEVRDDVIVLEVVSRDIVPTMDQGSTVQMRYKGQIEFEFDRAFLQAASAADVKQVFDGFFEQRN